jgi:hypothetical protein
MNNDTIFGVAGWSLRAHPAIAMPTAHAAGAAAAIAPQRKRRIAAATTASVDGGTT